MDIDEDIVKLQGALSSFQIKTSDKEKLEILRPLFENAKESVKVKMIFFLILNTRMKITELLKDDINVGLLTDICENLDFSALSCIIFNLNLVSSLSGIVSNSPAALTVELLHGIFANTDSEIKVKGLEKVITAIFEKILKISKGIQNDLCFMCELWDLMNVIGDMVWCKTSFESEQLHKEDINRILETCLDCVNLYKGNTTLFVDCTFEISTLYVESNNNGLDRSNEIDCKLKLKEYLCKLFDVLYDIHNNFSSNEFCETEYELISRNAYILYEELKDSEIEPSNIFYLNSIKKKPETESEKILKSDINTIISEISNDKASKIWFKALVNFTDAIENEEAIICILNHLDVADSQDLMSVIASVETKFKKNSISEILQKLYFTCLSKMTLVDQLFHFENYFMLHHRPCFETSTLDEELTETFNKISESNGRDVAYKSCLISFCIRSPVKTITKICKQALSSTSQLNASVEDLKMLKAACLSKDVSSDQQLKLDVITSVLHCLINEDLTLKEKQFLISLITRLQKEKLLEENIEISIMNLIHKELSAANYEKTVFALEILRSSIKAGLLRSNSVVLLAFMSQVLNKASWSFSSFSMQVAKIREIVIAVIILTMRSSKFSANDKEMAWIRKQIMKSWEINQLYFCDLWYSYDCDFITSSDLYVQLLILLHTKTRVNSIIDFITTKFQSTRLLDLRISFTAAFIQILPILTGREWTSLFTHVKSIIVAWLDFQVEKSDIDVSLEIFRIFTMSLYTLAQDMNRNTDVVPCFGYCIRNFGKIIQQNFLTCKNLSIEVCVVFVKELLFLLNGIQDLHYRKENSIILSPVILEIGNRARNNTSEKEKELKELEVWFKQDFIQQHSDEMTMWNGPKEE